MSMVGTFDGFTAARLGIYAAQHGLRTTGNNVANINTQGYTRQRVDQMSFKVGANDKYRSFYDNHVGSGALVTGINQIRDPYLDIRYRNASTDTYHYDTWLSGLQNIASILDEVGKGENDGDGLLYRQLQDLASKLRTYGNDPTSLNDRLARSSAESLVGLFHNAATQLEKLYDETVTEFNESISAVNEILTNIRDLNKSIRDSEIHGDSALEMRDERNRQIDALSQYLDIKVEYSFEDVGSRIQVEKLTIRLNNANPDSTVKTDESILVDGVFATQLSVPEERPVVNTYGGEHTYLKGYRYLKEYSPKDLVELAQFLSDNGLASEGDLVKALDENGNVKTDDNGNPIYLIGTNDPDVDGIVTEANDNFTIQLGKLLNVNGEEWKRSTTSWLEVDSATVLAKASFAFAVKSNLEDGDSFKIGGVTYTVGTNIDAETVEDPVKFAEFVAQRLDKTKYPGYTISSNEAGQIVFTVTDPDNPPEDLPTLSVNDPDDTGWIVVGNRTSIPTKTYDEHGNVTKSVGYVQFDDKWYEVTIGTEYTHEIALDDNDLRGILQAQREMLTEEGEFASEKDVAIDENALTKRGIRYYQQSLDLLAQKFAKAYNQLNMGYAYNQNGNYIDEDGNELLINDYVYDEDGKIVTDETTGEPVFAPRPVSADGLTEGQLAYLLSGEDDRFPGFDLSDYVLTNEGGYLVDENGSLITDEKGKPILFDAQAPSDKAVIDIDRILEECGGYFRGGELFTQLDGETTTGITAANISVSGGWSNGRWNLVPTFEMLFKDDGSGGLTNSTQSSNTDHMIVMIEKALTYNPRDLEGSDAIGPELFNGSFNDMLSNMMAKEGEDSSITNVRLATSAGILNEVDYSREGVSGVDLNDEAMNMITYQKAMTAAMRVMTAIDEVLDKLINNTGIAGR